jgi:hypothetical protein
VAVSATFDKPELTASPCEFVLKFPFPTLTIVLPTFVFPPFPLPIFSFSFAISCSLDNPIDVTAGLEWGGSRKALFDPDPDDQPDDT